MKDYTGMGKMLYPDQWATFELRSISAGWILLFVLSYKVDTKVSTFKLEAPNELFRQIIPCSGCSYRPLRFSHEL